MQNFFPLCSIFPLIATEIHQLFYYPATDYLEIFLNILQFFHFSVLKDFVLANFVTFLLIPFPG